MRRTTTLTALLLGTTLLAPTGLATAAGETCRGEAATIVGTGYQLRGTEGRDVIVTGVSGNIVALGGDDVICATGAGSNGNSITIDAGTGNDVVDSTTMEDGYYLQAILGDGADTFVGGPEDESVVAGPASSPVDVPAEGERDVIDTGDGGDFVTSGGPGLPNNDGIRTGDGEDSVIWSGTMGAEGILDGGAGGGDVLGPRTSGQTFRIDLAAQTLSQDGALAASFSSFERTLVSQPGAGTLEVIGNEGNDIVEVYAAATVRVDLHGGNDQLTLRGTKPQSRIDLGSGTDDLEVQAGIGAAGSTSRDASVELDLTRSHLVVDGSQTASVRGVEDASVLAHSSTLVGDGRANRLFAVGCLTTMDSRGGKDSLAHSTYDAVTEIGYQCERGGATLRGGSGDDRIAGKKLADRLYGGSGDDEIRTSTAINGTNKVWGGRGNDTLAGGGDKDVLVGGAGDDRLVGSKQADVLLGGAGKDRGDGGPGRDSCRTEVEKTCER